MKKAFLWVAILGALTGGGYVLLLAKPMITMGATMAQLVEENHDLRQALANLSQTNAIGYAKVLDQQTVDGVTTTQVKFAVMDPTNPATPQLEHIHTVTGDEVYFDLLVVNFDDQLVQSGERSALYLWRRIFGSGDAPEDGLIIETPGTHPKRYTAISQALELHERQVFWDAIWDLANNPTGLTNLGITAIDGKAAYRKMKPGLIYTFNLKADGEIETTVTPDL